MVFLCFPIFLIWEVTNSSAHNHLASHQCTTSHTQSSIIVKWHRTSYNFIASIPWSIRHIVIWSHWPKGMGKHCGVSGDNLYISKPTVKFHPCSISYSYDSQILFLRVLCVIPPSTNDIFMNAHFGWLRTIEGGKPLTALIQNSSRLVTRISLHFAPSIPTTILYAFDCNVSEAGQGYTKNGKYRQDVTLLFLLPISYGKGGGWSSTVAYITSILPYMSCRMKILV